jgi:hypothetical protein
MPKMHKLTTRPVNVVYDLDGSVGYGQGCKNLKTDVALVQYLLAGYYAKASKKPLGKLIVDGQFGPITHYWSLFFQLDRRAKEADNDYIEMGNFLPISDGQFGSSIISMEKMIVQLNCQFFSVNTHLIGSAEKDPAFPAILRGTIKAA